MTKKKKYSLADGYKKDLDWEHRIKDTIMKDFEYHPERLSYVIPESKHKYYPDWILKKIDNEVVFGTEIHNILVEAKGYFRTKAERDKYIHVRNALPPNYSLVFLFMKPHAPLKGATKRKNGTKKSNAEWAEENNFRWFTEETIQQLLKE